MQAADVLTYADVMNKLRNSNWKERLNSMEAVQQQVQDMKENLEGITSVLIQGVSFLPGWSEKNFQVGTICGVAGPCAHYQLCCSDSSDSTHSMHAY